MKFRPTLCALAIGAALANTSGCSLVLVHGPPSGHERLGASSCTRGNALPILDAVAAGTSLYVGGALLAGGTRNTGGWGAPYGVVGAAFTVEGLLYGTSAVLGFIKTSRCRAALRERDERGAGAARGPAPRATPPGP